MVSSLCNIFAIPTEELCSSTSKGTHLNCQHAQTDLLSPYKTTLGLWVFHSGVLPRLILIYPVERDFTPDYVEIIAVTIAAPGASGKPLGPVCLLALEDGNMMSTNRSPSLRTSKMSPGPEASPTLLPMRDRTPEERARPRSAEAGRVRDTSHRTSRRSRLHAIRQADRELAECSWREVYTPA